MGRPQRSTPAPRPTSRRRLRLTAPVARPGPRCVLRPSSFILLLFLLLPACSPVEHTSIATVGGRAEGMRLDRAPEPERIKALTAEIRALSPKVSPADAADCAARAIRYARLLADTYGVTDPPEFSNLMINLGLKKRGLCYQLADDLKAELVDQHYKTLVFTRGIAYRDIYLREHNCVVATAPGQPFDQGIVLDPWRNAGTLRWSRVKLDDYPWVPRETSPTTANQLTSTTKPAAPRTPMVQSPTPAITITPGKINGG